MASGRKMEPQVTMKRKKDLFYFKTPIKICNGKWQGKGVSVAHKETFLRTLPKDLVYLRTSVKIRKGSWQGR